MTGMRLVASLVCMLIAVVRSQTVIFESNSNESVVTTTTLETPSSASTSVSTTKAPSLSDGVICKIDENLHEGALYNGSLFNCTHSLGCLMNDDRRLEAEKTVLECIGDEDRQTFICMFEWYVHWRNCVGFNCYGVALDCEYEKRDVGSNVTPPPPPPPTVSGNQQAQFMVHMFPFGIAAVAGLFLSAIVACCLYHYRHSGMVDFQKRERIYAARMAYANQSTTDPPTFCTISAYDETFVTN